MSSVSGKSLFGRYRNWIERLQAAALDLPIIVGWAVFAGVTGGALRLLNLDFNTPAAWDLFALSTLVLPVTVTFALMEASPRRATPGKRRLGLVVVNRMGQRLSVRRSLARSTGKFLPWQLAHTAVFQLLAGSDAAGYLILSIAAQALVLASTLTMAFDSQNRPFHDLVAGTRVVQAPPVAVTDRTSVPGARHGPGVPSTHGDDAVPRRRGGAR